jgi:hypothetical protein
MVETTYTQRKFSELTGLSTATIVKMLNSGELKRASDGKIPESEVTRLIIERIKNYSKYGYLVIFVDLPNVDSADLNKLATDYFTSANIPEPVYVDSVQDIYSLAAKNDDNLLDITKHKAYNEKVLKLFMTKYNNMITTFLNDMQGRISGKKDNKKEEKEEREQRYRAIRGKLPYDAILELAYYGKVLNYHNNLNMSEINIAVEELQEELNYFQNYLNNQFLDIMKSLYLIKGDPYDTTKKDIDPIFTRDMLTPNFFMCKDAIYNMFFSSSDKHGLPIYLRQLPDLAKSIADASQAKTIKTKLDTLLSNGYYTVVNMNYTDSGDDLFKISERICGGLYDNVIIGASYEAFDKKAQDSIKMAIKLASTTNHVNINYIK